MAKAINITEILRDGSAILKMYNEIKDGKVHKLSVFRAKFNKAGISKPIGMAMRLCRILRKNQTGKMVELSKRSDTIQLVPFRAAGTKSAVKPVTAVAKKKVATKKPTKAKAVSQVAVAVGHSDEDLTEE